MKLVIPYGDSSMPLSIPDERLLALLTAADSEAGDEKNLLRASLEQPTGAGTLASFALRGKPLLVLVNDATRPTPTAMMLETLQAEVGAAETTFLVATGTHRAPTGEEMGRIFGSLWPEVREQVMVHDCHARDQLVKIGTTSGGNDVELNRMVVEAGRILVLGSVEAHYFAGYTGGRKIFLPGVAGFETIERNHRLAMEPGAEVMRLEGNPVNEEMEEALGLLSGREIYAVLGVLDREHRINAVFAGDIEAAFARAAGGVRRLFTAPIERKADIVVAVATHPLDLDFYQAQKAIENGKLVLSEGGTLILVSACRDGVGNDAFLKIMSRAGTPEQVLELAGEEYHLGYHKAARLAELAIGAELRAVAGVEDDIVRKAFMEPFASAQEALDATMAERPEADVVVLMDAGTTVPMVAGGGES